MRTDGRRHTKKSPKIDSKSQNLSTPTITAQFNYQKPQTVTRFRPVSKQQQRVLLTSNVPKDTACIYPKHISWLQLPKDVLEGLVSVSQILQLLRIAEESKSLACPITVREHRVRSGLKPFSQVCDHCTVPSAPW